MGIDAGRNGFVTSSSGRLGEAALESSYQLKGLSRMAGNTPLPAAIFRPGWLSPQRIGLNRSRGARIVLVPRELGRAFVPRQFSNPSDSAARESATGPAIWWRPGPQNLIPAASIAGVGTGGAAVKRGRRQAESVLS
jgi:cysteine synthase A